MKALSIRQPWAWLIVNGFKPIENRSWNTNFRGRILIHASLKVDREGEKWVRKTFPAIKLPDSYDLGGIVGSAELHDVVTSSSSKWFSGPFGLKLACAKVGRFIPLKGKLHLFEVPENIARAV